MERPPLSSDNIFNYIGKKDINNNKIYAKSSIIEWYHQKNKYTGFFKWDTSLLCYVVVTCGNDDENYNDLELKYYYLTMSNCKIIEYLRNQLILNNRICNL